MADTVRELVVQAALARLQAIPGIAGLTVAREPSARDALVQDDLPLVLLFEAGESDVTEFSGEQAYSLGLIVMGAVTAATDAAAATALNELRGRVDQAILADVTLGGAARFAALDPEAEGQEPVIDGTLPCRAFLRGFTVEYATREGDPFTAV